MIDHFPSFALFSKFKTNNLCRIWITIQLVAINQKFGDRTANESSTN